MSTAKAVQKLDSSKIKNKENKVFMTYKSLNPLSNNDRGNIVLDKNVEYSHREPELKKKTIPIRNYRTKQNSPNKRVPSASRVELSTYNQSKINLERPASNLALNGIMNNQIFNQKHSSKKGQTLRDVSSNIELLKSRHEPNLNATVSNTIDHSQISSFVGRRRQSPQPTIFGNEIKAPLKQLHYHRKKVPLLNQNPSKPIIA